MKEAFQEKLFGKLLQQAVKALFRVGKAYLVIRCINKKKLYFKFFLAGAVGAFGPFFFIKLFTQITMPVTGTVGVIAVYAKFLCDIGLVYVERSNHKPVAEGGSHEANEQYKNASKLHSAAKVAHN